MVKEDYPELKLVHSEGCIELVMGSISPGSECQQAMRYAHDMIGIFKNGTNSWIDWNIFLDETGGPNHVFNYCNAPILCDSTTDQLLFQKSYYVIAHFSKYFLPGAVRIGTSVFTDKLEIVGVKNPDQTIALVVLNRTETDIPYLCVIPFTPAVFFRNSTEYLSDWKISIKFFTGSFFLSGCGVSFYLNGFLFCFFFFGAVFSLRIPKNWR